MTVPVLAGAACVVVVLVALGGPRPARRPGAGVRSAPQPPGWFAGLVGAGGPVSPERAWASARVAGPGLFVVVALAAGPLPAVTVAVLATAAPRVLRPHIEHRWRVRRDAQLPATLERLASSLRAGDAPTAAFTSLAAATSGPLGDDLRGPAAEIQHGAPMAAAIDRWAGAPGTSPAVQLAAAALSLAVHTGGHVARSMDRVAATLRERQEVQAEVHALATQARASAAVLALAPFGFTALVSTIEPGIVHFLVATPVGALCLVAGVGLEAGGALWMARITSTAA